MDFGVLGLDGYVGPEGNSSNGLVPSSHESAAAAGADQTSRVKILGSGLAKQEKPSEEEWRRTSKMLRGDDFCVPKTMPLHHTSNTNTTASLLRSNSMVSGDSRPQQEQHMLSFSSLKHEAITSSFLTSKDGGGGMVLDKAAQSTSFFPYYHHTTPPSVAYTRSAGYGAGNVTASLHGSFTGARGPFTPSQWMELEHQALIYKYITSNVPVPSNLLIPLKKSLYPYGISGSFVPNSLGWGTFHLGYPGNTSDPEPGRCRRTDGKKWRCSRDAVADQKYCERHINRGRHRSRKPVEGQTGHAAGGTTNTKVAPMTTSMSTSVITSGGASNSLVINPQQQFKNAQPGAANSFSNALVNRAQDPRGLSMVSSTMNLKSGESTFNVPKQAITIQESSELEFGLVSTDSLLNPSQRSSYLNSKNYESFLNFSDQESQDQHPLRQFTDDWPKDQSNRSVISWPEELKSDWTQLSMSIPMSSSDFSSSSSSPTQEKHALSPLRLSREFRPSNVGMGVNNELSESGQKQANWIPISWGTSMGGPLGEVLSTSTGNAGCCKSSSARSLLSEGWDGSPQLGSSPTGVLQKAPFSSLSNSSSGSSPRAESKKNNGGVNLCDDMLGSTIVSSTPIPSL